MSNCCNVEIFLLCKTNRCIPRVSCERGLWIDLIALHKKPEPEEILGAYVDWFVDDDPGDCFPTSWVRHRPLIGHVVHRARHQLLQVDPVNGVRLSAIFDLEMF